MARRLKSTCIACAVSYAELLMNEAILCIILWLFVTWGKGVS